jgi:TolB-like protein/Tfp pilus assembly protein PilF
LDALKSFLLAGTGGFCLNAQRMPKLPSGTRSEPAKPKSDERLDSWKGIASHLGREVRTVQRWEKTEGLPVRRHNHRKLGSVYAIKSELDSWSKGRETFHEPVKELPAASVRIRLAVLPFENLSGDPSQEYFSDGLTEEMIAQLGGLQPDRLGVIARTTMMRYQGTRKSVERIGRELDVNYLLEGSVRQASQRVRITAQLIKVSDQTHLWAESYERGVEDVLGIQIEVAKRIARSLTVELLPEEHAALVRTSTTSAAAHDAYLRGRYCWNKRSEDNFVKAIEYFQQAVALDPEYAAAYAGLADCYDTVGWYGAMPAAEAYRRAKTAAQRALQINEKLAEAHAALAYGMLFHEWNWPEIEKEYQRALELNPNYVTGHHWYALFLTAMGRFSEAITQMRCALELDPFSPVLNSHLGWIFYFARQNDRAVEQLQKTVEMEPQFAVGRCFLGIAYEGSKKFAAAMKELNAARELSKGHPLAIASLSHVCGLAGKKAEAKRYLEMLKETSQQRHVSPYFFALAYAGMGEKEQVFTWLEKAYVDRSGWLVNMNVEPGLDRVRSDPRFAHLARRVGLPVVAKSQSAD